MTGAAEQNAVGKRRETTRDGHTSERAVQAFAMPESSGIIAFSSVCGDRQPPQLSSPSSEADDQERGPHISNWAWSWLNRFMRFLGPGAIISVAYVDPDNYQTAISSGASFQYKLLFMVLVSNLIAVYLQVRSVQVTRSHGADPSNTILATVACTATHRARRMRD